ncbi:MAG: hypothetical protein KF690_10825 [Bacteroidetes bacterium]|nr:hypothetical protein [Bacteroidota bacterium]
MQRGYRLLGLLGTGVLGLQLYHWLPLIALHYAALVVLCIWWAAVFVMVRALLRGSVRHKPWIIGVCTAWLVFQLIVVAGVYMGWVPTEGVFDWKRYFHWSDAYWPLCGLIVWLWQEKRKPLERNDVTS